MNDHNLKPFNTLTVSEQREIASKGGRASGEARRKKAAMQEMAQLILGLKAELTDDDIEMYKSLGLDPDEIDNQTHALMVQSQKAMNGNLSALTFLRDTAGEKPTDSIGLTHEMLDRDFTIVITGRDDDND